MANRVSATESKHSTTVSEDYMEGLMRRVDVLEKKLLSQDRTPPLVPLTTAVKDLEKKLDLLVSREKSGDIKRLWNDLEKLEKAISPEYIQSIKMNDDVKAELLCTQLEQLQKCNEQMKEVHQLKDYINSTECQGLEKHEKDLSHVAAIHLEQETHVTDLTRQTHALMESYRKLMLQLSAQCVQWDETLRHYETTKT